MSARRRNDDFEGTNLPDPRREDDDSNDPSDDDNREDDRQNQPNPTNEDPRFQALLEAVQALVQVQTNQTNAKEEPTPSYTPALAK